MKNLKGLPRSLFPIILIVVGFLGLVVFFIYYQASRNDIASLRCPSDYSDSKDSIAALDIFIDSYMSYNPKATLSDLLAARMGFYITRNCTVELEKYKDVKNGNVDDATKQMLDSVIGNYSQQEE